MSVARGSPRVLDLTGPRTGPEVVVEASTAAEVLVSLIARGMEEARSTYDPRPAGLSDDEGGLPEGWERSFKALGGADASWMNLLAFAPPGVEGGDIGSFLDSLESTDARQLWLGMAGAYVSPIVEELSLEVLERASDGDRKAVSAVRKAWRGIDKDNAGIDHVLGTEPSELKTAVVGVLRSWSDIVFARRMERTADILERDAGRVRRLTRSETAERVIELASRGLEFRPEAWIQRVVLFPHVAMRPWNVLSARMGDSLICYPVADESLGIEPGAPPPALVRLHRALGDEKRLRMLSVLASTPEAGLQELADAVGLAKSSAHHHLVVLRAAGLISVTTDGRGRYRLRRDFLPEASVMLGDFLGTA